MDCQLKEKNDRNFLIITGSSTDGTYYSFLNTKQAFGLEPNKPITVKMVLKRGDYFKHDYIKIIK